MLSSAIEAVWKSQIWESEAVTEITPQCLQYDIAVQNELDVSFLCYNGEVNFFLTRTARRAEPLIMGQIRYTFSVQVSYYLQQADIAQNTYRTVRDRLEIVDDLVLSALGKTWGGLVDFWQAGNPSAISEIEVSEKKCWTGALTYTAFKTS